jgi:hypothetical protein
VIAPTPAMTSPSTERAVTWAEEVAEARKSALEASARELWNLMRSGGEWRQ